MDEATATDLAASFRLGEVVAQPAYVTRGAMGEIWRLDTTTGDWAVKALFEWSTYPPMPEDVAIQRAADVAGIPLPTPVVVDGTAVQRVRGTDFRVYEWVELDPPLASPVHPTRAEEAGALLAKVHALPFAVEDRSLDPWYTCAPAASHYRRLADRSSAQGRPWADDLRAADVVIQELMSFIAEEPGAVALCHRDFEPTNVLPRSGDGPLVVLDWENAGPLPQDQELAAALQGWTSSRGAVDLAAAEALLLGYRRAGGPASPSWERSFSMSAATALNFVSVMAEQALTDQEHRRFAEDRLNQLLPQGLWNLLSSIRALVEADLP